MEARHGAARPVDLPLPRLALILSCLPLDVLRFLIVYICHISAIRRLELAIAASHQFVGRLNIEREVVFRVDARQAIEVVRAEWFFFSDAEEPRSLIGRASLLWNIHLFLLLYLTDDVLQFIVRRLVVCNVVSEKFELANVRFFVAWVHIHRSQ